MSPETNKVQDMTHAHLSILEYKGEHTAISGIGIIHGLASNDELLLLFTLSLGLSDYIQIFTGLFIFTLGVVFGMILFSMLVKLPFSKYGQEKIIRIVNVSIALITLSYGLYSLLGGETVNLVSPIINEDITGALFVIAFILGIKHSMDADHVVAISSILLRAPDLKKTISLSIAWALGHMVTASIITFILFGFKDIFLDKILANFESLVAIMLIIIAVLTLLWEFNIIQFGKHSHGHAHEDGTIHHHD